MGKEYSVNSQITARKINLVLSEECVVSSLVGVRKQEHLMELCSIISKENILHDI